MSSASLGNPRPGLTAPSSVRVRFAPSPTGHLHVGGARTALFNWLFARHLNGTMILRIEDTDAERSRDEYTEAILAGLTWLGLDWDEGPGREPPDCPAFQSRRLPKYQQAIEKLLAEGKAYHCFCSPETLASMRAAQAEAKDHQRYDGRCRALSRDEVERRIAAHEPFVLRLRMNEGHEVAWDDLTKGPLRFSSDLLDDLVIVKSDGFPTYNLAVVVDDVDMRITHVIRGEDHISNTPKQIMIYHALGAPVPTFAHIPMILGADRSRLSKRHGATSVVDYKGMGILPAAMRNYLALLGWSPEGGGELFSREDLIRLFSLERVSSHGAVFDLDKLRWMNQEYLKTLAGADLLAEARPWLERVPGFPGEYGEEALIAMVGLFRERMKSLTELPEHVAWFFADPPEFDAKGLEKGMKTPGAADIVRELAGLTGEIRPFAAAQLEPAIRALAERRGRKAGEVIHLARLALTGRTATPGLFELMELLGSEACHRRLHAFAAVLGAS
jgi:glutamyl-tRNA synthetase